MIMITGPGRSGTTVVAQIYKELGFDPGGKLVPTERAGLEAREIVEINNAIIGSLELDTLIRGCRPSMLPTWVKKISEKTIPVTAASQIKRFFASSRDRTGKLNLINWDKFDQVVEIYKETLQLLSNKFEVCKDPRFSWTLPVWAAANAKIDNIVVCIRSLSSMVKSRLEAGHLETRSLSEAKNSVIYATGTLFMAIYSFDLPYVTLKFPFFLKDPKELYKVLPFPEKVEYKQFERIFFKVVDLDKVHEADRKV